MTGFRSAKWSHAHIDALVNALADANDPEAVDAATQDLCREFEPFAKAQAVVYWRRCSGTQALDLQDFEQVARLGIIRACRKFQHSTETRSPGARFDAFLLWCMRAELQTFVEHNYFGPIKLPQSLVRSHLRMKHAIRQLSHELKRPPTTEEIAAALGIDADELTRVQQHGIPIDGMLHHDRLATWETPEAIVAAIEEIGEKIYE